MGEVSRHTLVARGVLGAVISVSIIGAGLNPILLPSRDVWAGILFSRLVWSWEVLGSGWVVYGLMVVVGVYNCKS